jgi:acyl-CoA synthetase (AMP-forming)/AMP-acid ligase II
MLKTIEENKIQVIFCLPAMYRALLDHPQIKETDLSSVEKCIYAMTPMDQRTLSEAIKVFGADFLLGTGQTECFPSTNTFHPEWQLKKSGKVDEKALDQIETETRSAMEERSHVLANTARLWDDGLIDPRDTRSILAFVLGYLPRGPHTPYKAQHFWSWTNVDVSINSYHLT